MNREGFRSRVEHARAALRNASEMLRKGRIGGAWQSPFHVWMTDRHATLRRYVRAADGASDAPTGALLLVPPLMVTAEIYDISPEQSAVSQLSAAGADVWVVDFGAPEDIKGGLERTLDDHILAVSRCIDTIIAATRKPVHLVGYSQGGLFCYQTAAWRQNNGIASIVAFGSPVDIRRNIPIPIHDSLAARLIAVLRAAIDRPLEALRGIPGTFSSSVFKLLAPRQELRHLIQMLGVLHDRDALLALEPQRRFLGGEGFIAWPGPALRTFIDEFIVHNRLKEGGFVIAGRTVSLADLDVPMLVFVGTRDDLALPDSVRGIAAAAPEAVVTFVEVDAGHFGLVIGRRARETTWPRLLSFTAAVDSGKAEVAPADAPVVPRQRRGRRRALWARLGALGVDLNDTIDAMRWNLPRLLGLARLSGDAATSFSLVLKRQAKAAPERPFFIRGGRAYTLGDADQRVSVCMRALIAAGVRPTERVRVGVPSGMACLMVVAALNRLGAVAVVGPAAQGLRADWAVDERQTGTGPAHLWLKPLAGRHGPTTAAAEVDLDALSTDADSLDASAAEVLLPQGWRADAGLGRDLALVLAPADGPVRRISNRRWMALALALANRLEIKPSMTLWCGVPVDSADGLLLAVGASLVGGARLALPAAREPRRFLREIRHVGASIAFIDAVFADVLTSIEIAARPHHHPLRVIVGRGLDPVRAKALKERFGARVRIVRVGRRGGPTDSGDGSTR